MSFQRYRCKCCHIEDCDVACAECPDFITVTVTNIIGNPGWSGLPGSPICEEDIIGAFRRRDGLGCTYQLADDGGSFQAGCRTAASTCPECTGFFTYFWCTDTVDPEKDPDDCGDCFDDIILTDPGCQENPPNCAESFHFAVRVEEAGFFISFFSLECLSINNGDAIDGWRIRVSLRNICGGGSLLCADTGDIDIEHSGCPAGLTLDFTSPGTSADCIDTMTVVIS